MLPSESQTWHGNPDLVGLLRPVSELVEDPENARLHPESSIEAIRNSYGTFGQVKPVVGWADPDGKIVVVAGNGSLRAVLALGWTHLAVSIYPGSLQQARAYALEDNATAELSRWDTPKVAFQIRDIREKWDAPEVAWTPTLARFTPAVTPGRKPVGDPSPFEVPTTVPEPTRTRHERPSPTAGEAKVVINGTRLSDRQSLFLRAAVSNALVELSDPNHVASLGDIGPEFRDGLLKVQSLMGAG